MTPDLNNLFSQSEPSVNTTLKSLLKIEDNLKFIDSIKKAYHYSDEPKFFQFEAVMKNVQKQTDGHLMKKKTAGGASFFSERAALLKCLGESIERHSCTTYKAKNLIQGSYLQMQKNALDPNDIVCFSRNQRKEKKISELSFTSSSSFRWIEGKSLHEGKKILIPAQLIFYNYALAKNEKLIYFPISTGAAGGGCSASAITRGILEIIERDSFMITYLNKLSCYKVDLDLIKDKKIRYLVEIASRYKLEFNVIDITTDIGIPTFACIVIDKTGIGSAVLIGLRSNLNTIDAIEGCIEEALHSRDWMRHVHETEYNTFKTNSSEEIINLENRGMYWYDKKKIKYLDFWLRQKPKKLKDYSIPILTHHGEILKHLKDVLKNKDYLVYYVDVTIPEVKSTGYKVFKVIIPQLQPLYLDERFRYLGGKRLKQVPINMGYKLKNNFNKIPHPFL